MVALIFLRCLPFPSRGPGSANSSRGVAGRNLNGNLGWPYLKRQDVSINPASTEIPGDVTHARTRTRVTLVMS